MNLLFRNEKKQTSLSKSPAEIAPVEEGKVSKHRRPIDLDEYDNLGASDSSADAEELSDQHSAADVTSTSVSYDSYNILEQRMANLSHTLAEKQREISERFCGLIEKMSHYIDFSNHANSAKGKKMVLKADKMLDQASLMAQKQERIAQQFEALVFRLEQDNIDKDAVIARLKTQLRTAHGLLRDRGVDVEDVLGTADSFTADATLSGSRNKQLPHKKQHPVPRNPSHPPKTRRSNNSNKSLFASPTVESEIFSISEISFIHAETPLKEGDDEEDEDPRNILTPATSKESTSPPSSPDFPRATIAL